MGVHTPLNIIVHHICRPNHRRLLGVGLRYVDALGDPLK
jgi:hypothetical protein